MTSRHAIFTPEHEELQRIATWAETTAQGLRHELNPAPLPEVWDMFNADSSGCSRKFCDCDKGQYQRARARIRSAAASATPGFAP